MFPWSSSVPLWVYLEARGIELEWFWRSGFWDYFEITQGRLTRRQRNGQCPQYALPITLR